jgi:signal peptidase I
MGRGRRSLRRTIGDRSDSLGSRYHRDQNDGTIPVDGVVGRAFAVVWPLDRATFLRRPSGTFAAVPAP